MTDRDGSMKISARNKLRGTILEVTKGATTAHVRVDLGGGAVVTASITNEAVDELKLAKGQTAALREERSDGTAEHHPSRADSVQVGSYPVASK
jgi:molybdopterin-binding protein